MLYSFVNHLSPSISVSKIELLIQQFSTRWYHKWVFSVIHGKFIVLRPHIYEYSTWPPEIIGVTAEFSGHTVYIWYMFKNTFIQQRKKILHFFHTFITFIFRKTLNTLISQLLWLKDFWHRHLSRMYKRILCRF